jgi:hypothetical protein
MSIFYLDNEVHLGQPKMQFEHFSSLDGAVKSSGSIPG